MLQAAPLVSIHLRRVAACGLWTLCQKGEESDLSGLVKIMAKQRRAKIRVSLIRVEVFVQPIFDDLVPCALSSGVLHNGLMTTSRTSSGNNTKMCVTVAVFTLKTPLFSFFLLQSVLIGFPKLCGSDVEPTESDQKQTKVSSPWAGNKSERIQVLCALPNKTDVDTRYEAVFTLLIAWSDIPTLIPHFKKTSAHQLLAIRTQMGLGYHAGRLEELLILNRPCRPGER